MSSIELSATDKGFPIVAVVDTTGDATVIWHVITDPDSTTGRFNGGWVVVNTDQAAPTKQHAAHEPLDALEDTGDGEQILDPVLIDTRTPKQKAADLCRDTWIVAVDPATISHDLSVSAASVMDLDGFSTLVHDNVAATQAALDEAASAKGIHSIRLAEPTLPDPESFATAFHGDDVGKTCWLVTQAVAELVESWIANEATRRKRSWAKDTLGKKSRPLIAPQAQG